MTSGSGPGHARRATGRKDGYSVEHVMGTYLVNHVRLREGVPNDEALSQLRRTVEAHGGRCYLWDNAQGADRCDDESRVLVEFANMTDAENWYSSSDYADISQTYVANSIDLALVDGISPDFTMAGFAPTSALWPVWFSGNLGSGG